MISAQKLIHTTADESSYLQVKDQVTREGTPRARADEAGLPGYPTEVEEP